MDAAIINARSVHIFSSASRFMEGIKPSSFNRKRIMYASMCIVTEGGIEGQCVVTEGEREGGL